MSSQGFITNKKKLEFREIVLEHVKKILEISRREFKKGTKKITHANYSEIAIEEDNRLCYVQSVESLCGILAPYFDKDMKESYEKLSKLFNLLLFEFLDKKKEEIKKAWATLKNKKYDEKEEYEIPQKDSIFLFVEWKLRDSKEMFRELNLLLHRQDYLKGAIYGEIDEDEDFEE